MERRLRPACPGAGVCPHRQLDDRQWASALAGSTYLYLCRAPENFTATAGSLFDGPILEDTLYRVEHTDGDVRLTLAQP